MTSHEAAKRKVLAEWLHKADNDLGLAEHLLGEMLAEPGLGPKGALDPCFRIIWGALDRDTRSQLLPQVVRQVVFNPKTSSLTIDLDEHEIRRITDAIIEADLEAVEDPDDPAC